MCNNSSDACRVVRIPAGQKTGWYFVRFNDENRSVELSDYGVPVRLKIHLAPF
jgi:hypothetical protein